MKKIIILGLLSFVLILCLIITRNKEILLEVYSMNEKIGLVDDGINRFKISIYTNKKNSIISFPSKNIYELYLNNMNLALEDVIIEEKKCSDLYELNIEAKMPLILEEDYYSENNYLIIKNNKYNIKINIASLSILKTKNYEKLLFNDISGSYSSINKKMSLVGISINTINKYNKISFFRLGHNSYSNINQIIENKKLENEVMIKSYINNYNYISAYNNYDEKVLNYNLNFYPISHSDFKLIRRTYAIIKYDEKNYYIEDCNFCDLSFDKLKDYLIESEVEYA